MNPFHAKKRSFKSFFPGGVARGPVSKHNDFIRHNGSVIETVLKTNPDDRAKNSPKQKRYRKVCRVSLVPARCCLPKYYQCPFSVITNINTKEY